VNQNETRLTPPGDYIKAHNSVTGSCAGDKHTKRPAQNSLYCILLVWTQLPMKTQINLCQPAAQILYYRASSHVFPAHYNCLGGKTPWEREYPNHPTQKKRVNA